MSDRDGLPNGDGGPAFPQTNLLNRDGHPMQEWQPGMSLLDYFAAAALTGMCISVGNEGAADRSIEISPRDMARDAYIVADAMLSERAARSQRGKG